MQQDLAKVLLGHLNAIDDLNFIDKKAGLVRLVERNVDIENGFSVSKFPVSADVDFDECGRVGCWKDLVPNSNKKGILYFEDLGTKPVKSERDRYYYQSKLRLVIWINNKLIQKSNDCRSLMTPIITLIRNKFEFQSRITNDIYLELQASAYNIIFNEYSIFEKYSYKKVNLPFLFWPYEAVAIDYSFDYFVSKNCVVRLNITPEEC